MLDQGDLQSLKVVRTLLARRGIDVSRAEVRVQKGICYIRGFVSPMPTVVIPNLEAEIEQVARIIRTKPEIRNVVVEVTTKRHG